MQAEDLILDETFIAWYEKTDRAHEKRWSDWIDSNPEKQIIVDQAIRILESLKAPDTNPSYEHTLNARKRLMDSVEDWENSKNKIVPFYRKNPFLWAAAASVSLLLTALFLWPQNPFMNRTYATKGGETKSIDLPDGSVVTLNGNSTLTLPRNWENGQSREVWLDGEGYFSVRHTMAHKRFIVHTEDLHVEVLGTEFNIKKRPETTEVVLTTGKIQLTTSRNPDTNPVVMAPGEMVEFSEKSHQIARKEVNTAKYTSWKDGQLVFEDASIQDVVQLLEQNYGYEVQVDKNVSTEKHFNGIFPSDSVDVLLTALSKVYDLDIKRVNKNIIIQNRFHGNEKS